MASCDTDEELAGRARRGDRAAFDALMLRCQGLVYHLALRFCGHAEDARELAQEVFIRLFLKLPGYDPDRPFRPWLYRLATRVFLNTAERKRPVTRSLEAAEEGRPALDPPDVPGADPAHQAEARALREAVFAALLELPPHYRAAMLLRHVEGLSYDEVAAALGQPLGTVKTHLHRARHRLREQLGHLLPPGYGDEP
ncbi:MAG: RNA polymerase sigma factor [Armatimonadetes bacterium]|nr:RNA polymerase sigma factor [Armatimonadota bacterium]